ncbi:uncharacterized protein LOC116005736 [Ipomoea triloba]|uniref:uncharacterized protein LOC116005736 n=1 Tax=Ipomoea triloba TaxID=35885 RepID=UPI00125D1878|nr:uncharacterized protein LOC116005736 [Ipomoea triloba]
MSTLEKLGIFVYVLSKSASNRDTQERFQHSGETVSKIFKEVLNAMDGLSRDILVPKDPEFKDVPSHFANDPRYMPHFKDCIGAIDGTHIAITIKEEDQMRYRGRKGIPTTNVLAACDFDLLFTKSTIGDQGFRIIDQDPEFIPPDVFQNVEADFTPSRDDMRTREMTTIRDSIASNLVVARRRL